LNVIKTRIIVRSSDLKSSYPYSMSWNWRMINHNDTTHGWTTPLEPATLYGCLWHGYWQKGNLPNPSLTGNKASHRRIHKRTCRIATIVFSLDLSASIHIHSLSLSLSNHTNAKSWMFWDEVVKNKKQSPTKRFGFWWISLRHQQISENSIGDGWEGVSVFSKDTSCTARRRWRLWCKS